MEPTLISTFVLSSTAIIISIIVFLRSARVSYVQHLEQRVATLERELSACTEDRIRLERERLTLDQQNHALLQELHTLRFGSSHP